MLFNVRQARFRPLLLSTLIGLIFAVALGFGVAGAQTPAASQASAGMPDFSDWLSQAGGMNKAIGIQRNEGRPMLVYFYADWCNFCRQFERELLSDSSVSDYLKDLIVVRINPESGPAERRFANMYRVNGYPSLFVHSGASKTLSRIDRMKLVDGKPRMMVAQEFIDTVAEASAR